MSKNETIYDFIGHRSLSQGEGVGSYFVVLDCLKYPRATLLQVNFGICLHCVLKYMRNFYVFYSSFVFLSTKKFLHFHVSIR